MRRIVLPALFACAFLLASCFSSESAPAPVVPTPLRTGAVAASGAEAVGSGVSVSASGIATSASGARVRSASGARARLAAEMERIADEAEDSAQERFSSGIVSVPAEAEGLPLLTLRIEGTAADARLSFNGLPLLHTEGTASGFSRSFDATALLRSGDNDLVLTGSVSGTGRLRLSLRREEGFSDDSADLFEREWNGSGAASVDFSQVIRYAGSVTHVWDTADTVRRVVPVADREAITARLEQLRTAFVLRDAETLGAVTAYAFREYASVHSGFSADEWQAKYLSSAKALFGASGETVGPFPSPRNLVFSSNGRFVVVSVRRDAPLLSVIPGAYSKMTVHRVFFMRTGGVWQIAKIE